MDRIDFANILPDDGECFCGSHLIYSECHKQKIYRNPNEIAVDLRKFLHAEGYCVHFNGHRFCGHKAISSHSIQRNVSLKLIAERGHVIGFNHGPNARSSTLDAPPGFSNVGIGMASTFRGFCSKHDSRVFKAVEEGELRNGYATALALAHRAQCYEAVVHSRGALFLTWLSQVPRFAFQFDPYAMETERQNMIYYAGYSWQLKKAIELIKSRGSIRKFIFASTIFDRILPIAAAGSFCIETDFLGRKLQRFSDFGKRFNFAQFSLLPQRNGTTYFCVSAVDDRDRVAARELIHSLRVQKLKDLADCALRLSVIHCENTYFSPEFIRDLAPEHQSELLARFDDSSVAQVGVEKEPDALSRPLSFRLTANVVSTSW